VARLSQEHPAKFLLFDILVDERGHSLVQQPLARRRLELERFSARYASGNDTLVLSPATPEISVARRWLESMQGQLDGLVAKRLDLPYLSGERAMQKIKKLRTADCVVGGFRYLANQKLVGSLLLGLYDRKGLLQHVGFTSSIEESSRPGLTRKLKAFIEPPGFTGRAPGGPSRWSSKKSAEWQPLRPELVVEVSYDHFTGHRFRHGTKLLRWRPDKAPRQCLLEQVDREGTSPLSLLV